MLTMDSVKLRLEREHELSFIEFNYMCLQAYDFVEINKRHGALLQMGGSDQWGNIVTGLDLGRRMGCPQLYAPHLAAADDGVRREDGQDGRRRGLAQRRSCCRPTTTGSIGATREDADVERFLKLFTFLPLEEIARLAALQGAEINEAKKTLATEATALIHGREAAEQAAATARTTFEEGALALSLPKVAVSTLRKSPRASAC